MANTKSACKRIEVAERNRLRNKAYKSTVKTLLKKTLISIGTLNQSNIDSVKDLISLSYSKIDKAIQKELSIPIMETQKKLPCTKLLKNTKRIYKYSFSYFIGID